MNQNNKQTTARPEDNVLNIQHGCPFMRTDNKGPQSTCPSPMDNISTFSEGNYADGDQRELITEQRWKQMRM